MVNCNPYIHTTVSQLPYGVFVAVFTNIVLLKGLIISVISQALNYTVKVSKDAKISNRYNQVPHLTQDTNGKVTISQLFPSR